MSSSLPQRPVGPPPTRAPPGAPPGLPPIKRPPGPPPGGAPVGAIKPPPMAPPPNMLAQSLHRPAVLGSKPLSTGPSRDQAANIAPAKEAAGSTAAPYKSGAISMFENDLETETAQEPAGGKGPPTQAQPLVGAKQGIPPPRGPAPPRGQVPAMDPTQLAKGRNGLRPLPPTINPPGIPEGQPLPPGGKFPDEKKAPPPTRPPPNRNRAPPREAPVEKGMKTVSVTPLPPTSEPPLLRVKKSKADAVVLKRRERDMPEYDSSSSDEEEPQYVKQPLPFGVIKQPLPSSALTAPTDEAAEAARIAAEEAAAAELAAMPTAPLIVVPASKKEADSMASPPSVAPPGDNKLSAFVPAAPGAMDKHFDDSILGKTLSRGRLSIRCVEGFDIRAKTDQDKIPRNDPFIKFRLGVAERHPWKSTEVKRKQDSNPKFDDEIVFFDITDPAQFVFQEDMQICIELWNKGVMANTLIASVSMSVVRFLKAPFVSYAERVPIYYPGATRTSMKLSLEFIFEEARSGMLQITLYEASNLQNIDPMGQQDPYVQFSLGKLYKKKSKAIKGGGVKPYFGEEEILMWIDQENWVDDLVVDVLDQDKKEDKPIGSTHFSVLSYMKTLPEDAKEDTFDLFYWVLIDPKDDSEKKEVAQGELCMRIRFLPAGKLTVIMERAKDLQFPEAHKPASGEVVRMDPYVNLTLEGKAVKMIKRTSADKDGGRDPVWESPINFEIVDQYLMEVEVFSQSLVGKDVLLGFTQLSLLNVYRNGATEYWTTLKQKKANGGVKEVGDIFVRLGFTGPLGIAFPQYRPEVDSYDDALRKDLPVKSSSDNMVDEIQETPLAISTVPDENEDVVAAQKALAVASLNKEIALPENNVPPEFTDQEIVAAFKFIDLDHNNFVGAAEIRHILVCMGEMITDEEIDMMIAMVDLDGDGQVSFKEFRSLVLHPNPGLVDMHKEINKDKETELMREKQAMAGKAAGLDLTAFQRQKEMTQRDQKKKMIIQLVIDQEINFEYIKQSYVEYLDLAKEKRVGGRVKFEEFCQVMRIEPITEYRKLHAMYDSEEMGDMDLREFLLSCMNFVDVEREARIRFSFQMFDEYKTGYISQREVEEILRGNHMISLASVQRKAETIMRQAHANKEGAITINEFVVVSKKFPNILLPAVGTVPPPPAPL